MPSNRDYYNARFSHIYVEQGIRELSIVERILERFPEAHVIPIGHYKDVFCRRGQNFSLQQRGQALILAEKHGTLIYPGAQVCQSFGNEYFYYTSCVMNCLYDCEYCYLKGMYPSGHMVLFVNEREYFEAVEQLLQRHPVYLCISYDTDLLALEDMTGMVGRWIAFARAHDALRVEVRTKCGRKEFWDRWEPTPSVVFAFTLSPQPVIAAWEHGTSSLAQRLESAAAAVERGFSVRLCFDPVLYCADWKRQYGEMLDQVFERLSGDCLTDVSVGSFRISRDYLKKMRRAMPQSVVVQFPFENVGGVCQYPDALQREMEEFLVERLKRELPEEKIYGWNRDRDEGS